MSPREKMKAAIAQAETELQREEKIKALSYKGGMIDAYAFALRTVQAEIERQAARGQSVLALANVRETLRIKLALLNGGG
jgi:hypothetical protein